MRFMEQKKEAKVAIIMNDAKILFYFLTFEDSLYVGTLGSVE